MGKRKHRSRSSDDEKRKRSRSSSSSTSSSSDMEPDTKDSIRTTSANVVSNSEQRHLNYKEKELHKHKKRRKSTESEEKRKKKKKKMKKEHKKSKKAKSKKSRRSSPESFGPVPPDSSASISESEKAEQVRPGDHRVMAPMTKEQWEKERSTIRRVFDPETGRNRLIRGNGEILEEIVSKKRHAEINKQATLGDGIFYQFKAGLASKSNAK